MRYLEHEPYPVDPDLFLKPVVRIRPDNGDKYYSCILCHVDGILMIHHDSMSMLEKLDKHFKLKNDSIGDPDLYLGAKFRKIVLQNEFEAWIMSLFKYVKESIKNCKSYLTDHFDSKYCCQTKPITPLPMTTSLRLVSLSP